MLVLAAFSSYFNPLAVCTDLDLNLFGEVVHAVQDKISDKKKKEEILL